jgi:hypothetical protein
MYTIPATEWGPSLDNLLDEERHCRREKNWNVGPIASQIIGSWKFLVFYSPPYEVDSISESVK